MPYDYTQTTSEDIEQIAANKLRQIELLRREQELTILWSQDILALPDLDERQYQEAETAMQVATESIERWDKILPSLAARHGKIKAARAVLDEASSDSRSDGVPVPLGAGSNRQARRAAARNGRTDG